MITVNHTDVSADHIASSAGQPLPLTEVSIRTAREDGAAGVATSVVPIGAVGEICTRGYGVMIGYNDNPEATAAAIDDEGWLHTGDLATMDKDGYFYIVGRKKDMINVSGFNVYPNEIEEIVTRMPGVVEAAAIAIPDENSGEAVKLFVVASDPELTADKVKAFCRDNLTGYKRPREVEFRDELPKSGVGKVLRRELRN